MGNIANQNKLISECWKEKEIPRHTVQHYFIFIVNIENDKSDGYDTNVENKMGTKEIRDPIYNFIHILPDDPYEKNIIDSYPFQRLRYIHQLGLTYYVYPGATHKRFEHSLGTMEIATKLFDSLRGKNKDIFIKDKETGKGLFEDEDEIERYRQILRIACLLHDIGHYPFSHSSEEIWGEKHEEMGSKIILSKDVRELIEEDCPKDMNIKAEEISFVVSNKPETDDARLHFLQQILSGDLGVDRIDYLVRDSLHTGVLYGMFDYYRLLDTFKISHDEDNLILCLEKGGVHAAEGLILARYFMFSQVYYHKTRSIYDILLMEYMKQFSKHSGKDYTKVKNFLELNDFIILNQLKEDIQLGGRSKKVKLANLILNRQHHKFLDEINADDLVLEENPERVYKKIEDKISRKYGTEVKNGDILFDRSMKKTNRFEEADFYVYKDGELSHIFRHSELIRKLKKIDLFRVYIARGKEGMGKKIKKILEKTAQPYIKGGR